MRWPPLSSPRLPREHLPPRPLLHPPRPAPRPATGRRPLAPPAPHPPPAATIPHPRRLAPRRPPGRPRARGRGTRLHVGLGLGLRVHRVLPLRRAVRRGGGGLGRACPHVGLGLGLRVHRILPLLGRCGRRCGCLRRLGGRRPSGGLCGLALGCLFGGLLLGLALGLFLGLALGAGFGLLARAFLGFLARAFLLGAEHRVSLGDHLADRLGDQRARADRVVVAGDHELDPVRIAVGVHQAHDRNAQAAGLFDRDLLGFQVDHEHRVGHALHVLHAAEVRPQLRQVRLGGHALARGQQRELALRLEAFEVVQPSDALVDRLEVGQQATEPAVVDIRHAGGLGDLLDGVAGLLLGAHEQHRAAAVGERAGELLRLREQRGGLDQIDDVDAAALAEYEAAHLWVPAARLVAEVDAGLQQLRDAYVSHGLLPCW